MTLLQPELFDAAERRLNWASERQSLLAQNIANLATPGFQAADERDFRELLGGSTGVQPWRTAPNHMAGTVDPGTTSRPTRETTTRTADKNGIRLEDQLMKVADTETIHSTVAAIYKKYMSMFNIALGKSG
jgi:flagellar basal-body rod protein FlgB